MNIFEVSPDVHLLTLNVSDLLFEEMWVIPEGVTLNSFVVKGEKTALIDGVCGWEGIPEHLYGALEKMNTKIEDIDHIIINHMEPDHSGWIKDFSKLKHDVKIHLTKAASDIYRAFFGDDERLNVVKAGDTLDLGNGRILEFIPQPGVHWPDTMMTYDRLSGSLFTCDLFGTFGTCEGNNFDDEFKAGDRERFEREEIRYYSNVLSTFNTQVEKGIEKARALKPKAICPGHGPIYRKDVDTILNAYEKIVGFVKGSPLDETCIVYGSMYGMTELAVNRVIELLEKNGKKYSLHKLPYAAIGDILTDAFKSKNLILAAPTYENKLFPAMAACVDELQRKKISGKKVMHLGSYGWSGGGEKEFKEIIAAYNSNWEIADCIMFKGRPTEADLAKLEEGLENLLK